jgi:hypothetical protein
MSVPGSRETGTNGGRRVCPPKSGTKRGTPGGTVNLDILLVGSVENECARETGTDGERGAAQSRRIVFGHWHDVRAHSNTSRNLVTSTPPTDLGRAAHSSAASQAAPLPPWPCGGGAARRAGDCLCGAQQGTRRVVRGGVPGL